MPSRLVPRSSRNRERQKQVAAQRATRLVLPVRIGGVSDPWRGYEPDLDPHDRPLTSARSCYGLQARALLFPSNAGEFLTSDDGWAQLDSANLPLGMSGAGSAITMLAQFRQAGVLVPMAIAAGDGGGTTAEVYRVTAGSWVQISYAGAGSAPDEDRDGLWDWAEFQNGAPSRTTAIDEPIIIFCTPNEEVQVYPDANLSTTYEEFMVGVSGISPFKARSVAVFDDRVNFLNTAEGVGVFPNRLRRSLVGDANVDPAAGIGAGFIDFVEFQRPGVRVLPFRNTLAVYFQNEGMAILRRTNLPTIPYSKEVITHNRGPVSTFAVTPISRDRHFGIFNDGWFVVDSSGNFFEVGVEEVNGVRVRKWRDTFYSLLNLDKIDRLVVSFDQRRNLVRISFPTTSEAENANTWVLDIDGDRVWPELYGVTYWGEFDQTLSADIQWGTGAPNQIDPTLRWPDALGSWADYAARVGFPQVTQGTVDGNVFFRDPQLVTRAGQLPTFQFVSHPFSADHPFEFLTGDMLELEYLNTGGSGLALGFEKDFGASLDTKTKNLSEGSPGRLRTVFHGARLSGTHLSWRMAGTHPVAIRSGRAMFLVQGGADLQEAG